MTKREKVIIGLMLTAVLFGAYTFLASPAGDEALNPEKTMDEINNAIVDLAGKINRNSISKTGSIIEKAKQKWKKDPFVQTLGPLDNLDNEAVDVQASAVPTSIRFTGFIHVGDKMVAIINGLEYEEGDIIGNGGLSVKKISREKVSLRSENGEDRVVFIEKY